MTRSLSWCQNRVFLIFFPTGRMIFWPIWTSCAPRSTRFWEFRPKWPTSFQALFPVKPRFHFFFQNVLDFFEIFLYFFFNFTRFFFETFFQKYWLLVLPSSGNFKIWPKRGSFFLFWKIFEKMVKKCTLFQNFQVKEKCSQPPENFRKCFWEIL